MSCRRVAVYTAGSPIRAPRKLVREMMADLAASRELAWRLFIRDTSAMYRQSALGYVWAFVPTLATTGTFVLLSAHNIVNVGVTAVSYPAYVMIGTLLWQVFVDAMNAPLKAVGGARAMLAKINFPREALVLSGIGEVLFSFVVRLVLLVPVLVYYKVPVGGAVLFVPLGIAGLVVLGTCFGILLTPVGMLYSDVGRAVTLVSSFWMLLTPVAYPVGNGRLASWNPVSPAIVTCREWLTGQPADQLLGFAVVTVGALVCLGAGWIVYRLSMPILIERMGG